MFRKLVVILLSLCFISLSFAIDTDSIKKDELETIQNSKNIAIKVMVAKGYKDFSLNEKSLKILDEMISKEGATYSEKMKDTLIQIFGSYLGELIVKDYDGHWAKLDDEYVTVSKSGMISFPFSKVYKHITNGSEDAIYTFYITAGLSSDDIEKLEKNNEINIKVKTKVPSSTE